jgi:hypothetical protein
LLAVTIFCPIVADLLSCYWALTGGTGGGGFSRPVLGSSHQRTRPERSQSGPTIATAAIVHQISAEKATASMVGQEL